MTNSSRDDLLLEEYKEAMNQRRHVENMRSGYLAFYFAFLVGTLSVITTLLEKNSNSYWIALGVPALLFLLSTVTTMLYITNRKMSALLGYYDNTTNVARKRIYDQEMENIYNSFDSYEGKDSLLNDGLFSMTGIVDKFLKLMTLVLLVAYMLSATAWRNLGLYKGIEFKVLAFLYIALFGFQLLIIYKAKRMAVSAQTYHSSDSKGNGNCLGLKPNPSSQQAVAHSEKQT